MTFLGKAHLRNALRAALQTRHRMGIDNESPINVFDLAERLRIEVKFAGIGSFGGMWVKHPKTILISSLRPAGRQVYTCAHELGHWCFGHGMKVDLTDTQEIWQSNDEEELLANTYAGFLLMPSWAVKRAFNRRSWSIADCTPLQLYTVACQLGVSYEALVTHMCYSLNFIARAQAQDLLLETPKAIRTKVFPSISNQRLIIVDSAWEVVPIDLQVGEHVLLPANVTNTGRCLSSVESNDNSLVLKADSPGITRLQNHHNDWSAFVRVCRRDFEGRSVYRYLEDPDE